MKKNIQSKASVFVNILLLFLYINVFAQPGNNGAGSTITNTYTNLAADAAAGATSFTVGSTSGMAAQDLLMIIQMQGATINSSNPGSSASWGAVTAYNSAGAYEFVQVSSVSGSTVNISCGLTHSYSSAGKTQVINVPRYTTLNISGSVTATPWNGTTGGVMVAEVQGNITISGSINANGAGFRGSPWTDTSDDDQGCVGYASTNETQGGLKGEGIAGHYTTTYDGFGGRFGRGAPANGGGGGNCHNASGGGGANAGNLAIYTGDGIPDQSNASWPAIWALEYGSVAAIPTAANSSGGGKGAPSFSSTSGIITSMAPGNTSWGGDFRRAVGGRGGRPLDYSTGRLFLGGGGGAGDNNDNAAGGGGNGGGMVFLISCGTISGGGSITANGANGEDNHSPGNDGTGGAGGGGTIVLKAGTGGVAGLTLTAKGGIGGNFSFVKCNYQEGPGGGGGGGYVSISSGTPIINVVGGANGTDLTGCNPPNFTGIFPPKNATAGAAGTSTINCNQVTVCGSPIPATCVVSPCSLPVELTNFIGWSQDEINSLKWTTASEKNNRYFVLERSSNGTDFVSIGTIEGHGNSSLIQTYYFDDKNPLNGNNYYRLKQVDYDGEFSNSKIILINNDYEDKIIIYPNPNNGEFTINILSQGEDYKLDIIDVEGRTVYSNSAKIIPPSIKVTHLAQGMYIARFYLNGKIIIKKLMVY